MEREVDGYYYDGEKSYVLYKDKDGNIEMERMDRDWETLSGSSFL